MTERIENILSVERPIYAFDYHWSGNFYGYIIPSVSGGLEVYFKSENGLVKESSYQIDEFDVYAKIKCLSSYKAVVKAEGFLYLIDHLNNKITKVEEKVLDFYVGMNDQDFILLKYDPIRIIRYDLNGSLHDREDVDLAYLLGAESHHPVKLVGKKNKLILCGFDRILVFDKQNLKSFDELEFGHSEVTSATISPSENYLALVGRKYNGCYLYDLLSGNSITHLAVFGDDVRGRTCLSFHPQGKVLAMANHLGNLMLLKFQEPREFVFSEGLHKKTISEVLFLNNGHKMYTSGYDGNIIKTDLSDIL